MVSTCDERLKKIRALHKILLGGASLRFRRPKLVLPAGVNYTQKEWMLIINSLHYPTIQYIWALEELIEKYKPYMVQGKLES